MVSSPPVCAPQKPHESTTDRVSFRRTALLPCDRQKKIAGHEAPTPYLLLAIANGNKPETQVSHNGNAVGRNPITRRPDYVLCVDRTFSTHESRVVQPADGNGGALARVKRCGQKVLFRKLSSPAPLRSRFPLPFTRCFCPGTIVFRLIISPEGSGLTRAHVP